MRKIRALVLAGGLGAASIGLGGCHNPADVVCEAWKPHRPSPDGVTFAAWDGPSDPSDYGGRYLCTARHGTSGTYHNYCVHPGNHYPPPDDQWAWQPNCNF
jgi:hypothetical protein